MPADYDRMPKVAELHSLTWKTAKFRAAKDSIYALYRSVPDLSERNVKQALDYFDGFYRIINDPRAVQREFVRGCRRPS